MNGLNAWDVNTPNQPPRCILVFGAWSVGLGESSKNELLYCESWSIDSAHTERPKFSAFVSCTP